MDNTITANTFCSDGVFKLYSKPWSRSSARLLIIGSMTSRTRSTMPFSSMNFRHAYAAARATGCAW
eukprot:1384623-Amphidinium_carterae.1